MRLGEALATCPGLVLVEQDPAAVEREWEGVLRRLEDSGFAVEPEEPGRVSFETKGVERLYGGLEAALSGRSPPSELPGIHARALRGAGSPPSRRRASRVPGRPWSSRTGRRSGSSRRCRSRSCRSPPQRYAELEGLGVRRLGRARRAARAERSRSGWGRRDGGRGRSRTGGESGRVRGRRPEAELAEALEFPEAVGNELTLRRAFGALLDRLLARPERAGRPLRKAALSARLVGGGSWRRTVTFREPTAERPRLRAALGPKLLEIPAPVLELRLEAVELSESLGEQLELVRPAGDELGSRLSEGLRQVRASTGSGSVCAVVEVAPWSRIPETRALFVPRDE